MGVVLKSIEHSGDDSPLVSLRDRCCRQRQVLTTGLEQIYASLGVHHLHGSGSAKRSGMPKDEGPGALLSLYSNGGGRSSTHQMDYKEQIRHCQRTSQD